MDSDIDYSHPFIIPMKMDQQVLKTLMIHWFKKHYSAFEIKLVGRCENISTYQSDDDTGLDEYKVTQSIQM